MVVCCATAKVGSKPEEIRLRTVCDPRLVMQAAFHLIGLLVILVSPHVVGESTWKGVKREAFEPVSQRRITEDGQ